MTKRKAPKDIKPAGQPTSYKPEYDEQAFKLCLLGATDKKIADFFDVTEQTINNWKIKHPTFFESLKNGKEKADGVIAESLYHRAKGYSHHDVHIAVSNGEAIQTDIVKHYPPDPTSCIFWLKNRQPATWRDKHDHEISGELKIGKIERVIIDPDIEDQHA